jgi:hypothetical protein
VSIAVMPNGFLRARVPDPTTGKTVSVAKVLGLPRGGGTWPNTQRARREAQRAEDRAGEILAGERARSSLSRSSATAG